MLSSVFCGNMESTWYINKSRKGIFMNLQELRGKLDEIDQKLIVLYEERMDICKQVAEIKLQTGKRVLDKEREKEKIATVCALAHNEFNKTGICELFEQIMSMSRKLQYQMLSDNGESGRLPFFIVDKIESPKTKVVFQGAHGAYSQAAMQKFFGSDINSFHVETFKDAMVSIEEGRADFAVLPIENSTAGIVSEIYDLLVEYENYIVGEQVINIEHCLLGIPGTKIDEIQTIYSHPQSLMQSSRFLEEHASIKLVSMQNNAFAAQKVSKEKEKTQAAIASEYAGQVYSLEILKKGIQNDYTNSTRFIIVTNQKIFKKDAKKVSICFEVAHESGSLYHALSHFIYNHLNICKIESRPIENKNWEYRFFLDFEGNLSESAVKNALRGLREETINMKILGNY